MLRMFDSECSVIGVIYNNLPPFKTEHCGRGVREKEEQKGREEGYGMPSSGHDKAVMHINSQQLCSATQDLYKIKPINILTWTK